MKGIYLQPASQQHILACCRYVAPEYLDGANKYFCKRHRRKMRASKCMTIDEGPAVLVLQLKRFAFAGFGAAGMSSKIHKKVSCTTSIVKPSSSPCSQPTPGSFEHLGGKVAGLTYLQLCHIRYLLPLCTM